MITEEQAKAVAEAIERAQAAGVTVTERLVRSVWVRHTPENHQEAVRLEAKLMAASFVQVRSNSSRFGDYTDIEWQSWW